MRRLIICLLMAAVALGVSEAPGGVRAQTIGIEPLVWTFGRDYPDGGSGDVDLPVTTVYIKTHDGDDWMARWDEHPSAVSGPEKVQELVATYGAQGIDVVAWFVPVGLNVERQIELAKQVIDTGVPLYADLEPFEGFCFQDCHYLAEHFWKRLRAERPDATLGVIYDPRTQWLEPSATAQWLAAADVALPMCYWESYAGQGVFGDPAGCVQQAWFDLQTLAPGSEVEYLPMLQGDTSAERFVAAMDAAADLGSERVSVWRRGVVPAEVWQAAEAYAGPVERPCWVLRDNGCYFREFSGDIVYLIQGGARFVVHPGVATQGGAAVEVSPDGVAALIPTVPQDGALLQESGDPRVYVVYGGARFHVPSPEIFEAMGFDWSEIGSLPAGLLERVPLTPPDYTRVSEFVTGGDYLIVGGAKLPVDNAALEALSDAGKDPARYVLPTGALDAFPDVAPMFGDVDCKGGVSAVDALVMLQSAASLQYLALCFDGSADVDCDADVDAVDALAVLRHVAALPVTAPKGCGAIGV